MESPLLSGENSISGDYAPARTIKEVKSMVWIETVKLWKIAGPITFNMLCQYGVNSFTTIFVGHLGDVQLSAITVAITVFGSFTLGFLIGMGSATETLCGQAYGAGKLRMLGLYMQKSWIISWVSCLFLLSPLYVFAYPVLKLLGQQDDIANLAGKFTLLVIPQLFAQATSFPTQRFLQAQSKVSVVAWIGFIALLVHILMLWLFIFVLDWGMGGAAIAMNVTNWGVALAQLVYILHWCDDCWGGWSLNAFKDIWSFVWLSIASAVMLCLEIWYNTSLVLITGHLTNAVISVGSLSICMNINGWEFIAFIGLNCAISVRVSNELGLGHPRAVKYSIIVIVLQSFVIGVVAMLVILVSKDYFSIIFTSDKDIQVAVSKLTSLLCITMVLNSVQPVISGVAVGGGWQALVAYINVGCYYIFGVPLGILLGYKANLGVKGVWSGMIAGTALQTVLLLIVLYRTNWKKQVEETTERMRKWGVN